MRQWHSWRSARKPPRLDPEYLEQRRYSYAYDVEDWEALNRVIASRSKVPRAKLARGQPTGEMVRREAREERSF